MKNFIRSFVSLVLVLTFWQAALSPALACGPYYLNPLFALRKHADFPLSEYTSGKIGVVPDTFGRLSLVIFYRYLNDSPLTLAEQKQAAEALQKRIGPHWSERPEGEAAKETETPDFYAEWIAARAKVLGGEKKIETDKIVSGGYSYFANCLPDAFRNATKTLEARIKEHGANEFTREWINGQDAVFSSCGDSSGRVEPAGEKFPEWLQKDRAYQIAASLFYNGDLPSARESFEKIAADESSVWKNTAKFVVARVYIRQASFLENSDDEARQKEIEGERDQLYQKASTQLENVLRDDRMTNFHSSARRLLGLVKYRSIPKLRQKELGSILAAKSENKNLYNDLIDYSWLLDHETAETERRGLEAERLLAEKENRQYDYQYQLKLRDVSPEAREDELTDWIFTFQAADGFAHAFDRWKQTGRAHWLIAALGKTTAGTPQLAELLKEAGLISPTSPAYHTVSFHQVRLLLETGRRAEAKEKLERILSAGPENLPVSTRNRFLEQRLSLSANLEEFLRFAQRKPAVFLWSDDSAEAGSDITADKTYGVWANRPMFDQDTAEFFNTKMPLSVLRLAALGPNLPPHLKKFLVTAVWTRAFVLGNEAIEREFTPLMSRYAVELRPQFARYVAAAGPVNRRAAALLTILRYPALEPFVPVGFGRATDDPYAIDSHRGNWWCARYEFKNTYWLDDGEKRKFVAPDFLTEAQRAAAESEYRKMSELGDSATFLARKAVEFAEQNPGHPSTPELLHLAVRATRFGCTDDATGKFSRQAFEILHKRYPNSVWTKKTPYWFGQIE